jgi:hypothetical protein
MRHKLTRIVMLSSALSALALATAAPAGASTETALVTVSSADLYAGCSIPGNPGQNFPGAEVEPQVAVNPHTQATSSVSGSRTAGRTVARRA